MNIAYWSVCSCLRVRACLWVPGRVGVCMRTHTHSLANPARNAYAPYCDVICGPLGLHYIFRHYLINGAIFEEVTEYKMYVFIYSTAFVQNISHSKKNLAWYRKNVETSSFTVPVILVGVS
jgi:hypothetical protein